MTAAAAAAAKMDGYRPYSTKVCLCTLFLIELLLDMEKLICTEITAQGIQGHRCQRLYRPTVYIISDRCCWQSRGLMGVPSRPADSAVLSEKLSVCVDMVSAWMAANRLQLNHAKTEVIYLVIYLVQPHWQVSNQ